MPAPPGCDADVYEIMSECWVANPDERVDFAVIHEAMREIQASQAPATAPQ